MAMAYMSFSVTLMVVVVITLMSLGMEGASVMAQVAPVPGPAIAEALSSGAVPLSSGAGVLLSLLAFAATGFAHL